MGLLFYAQAPTVPTQPPIELAIAENFQEFDGLNVPATNNTGEQPFGTPYGATPRPGQLNTPQNEQTYTRGPMRGFVNTLGGQPLPVANWLYRTGRGYTPSVAGGIQHRLGVGQNYGGVSQTAIMSEITNNPPVPGDLSSIISGWA
jgi:hypothetical protein